MTSPVESLASPGLLRLTTPWNLAQVQWYVGRGELGKDISQSIIYSSIINMLSNDAIVEHFNGLPLQSRKVVYVFLQNYYCQQTGRSPESYRQELGDTMNSWMSWDCYEPQPDSDAVKLMFMAFLDAKYQYWKANQKTDQSIVDFVVNVLGIA